MSDLGRKISGAAKLNKNRWDILAKHLGVKILEDLILKLDKETENDNKEAPKPHKILYFSTEWSFEEVLSAFEFLDSRKFSNLFVIIVKSQNFGFNDQHIEEPSKKKRKEGNKKIKEILDVLCSKFDPSRQLILQLTSVDENAVEFYFKDYSNSFIQISKEHTNAEVAHQFSTFLRLFLGGNYESIKQLIADWKQILKSTIIIKFLKLFDNIFKKLILEVTKSGTAADFLIVLEASIEQNGRVLSVESQQYLTKVFFKSGDVSMAASDEMSASEDNVPSSVLLTAIEYENTEVINILITYWIYLIQQLPLDHQISICKAALKSKQLDVLCDLLNIADFPLIDDVEPNFGTLAFERLQSIFLIRKNFKKSIETENFDEINEFINNNPELRMAFVSERKSAMDYAFDLKKFKVYFYLKSAGYQTTEPVDIEAVLINEDLENAKLEASKQKKKNINEANFDPNNTIKILLTKSGIHNIRTSKVKGAEYRKIIQKWLKDLYILELCAPVLDVVASCEHLKIIFDFESNTVEQIDLISDAFGLAYSTVSSNVFIGAKLSDKEREQRIKGTLVHELCHYAMSMVYDNGFRPYYENATTIRNRFNEIVEVIREWSARNSNDLDDECNGIISYVFTAYLENRFHFELIVRVVHILAVFHDNPVKSAYLQEKYKILFDFWIDFVVPELKNFLKKDKTIVHLNGVIELLPKIKLKKINIRATKVDSILDKKAVVIVTNVSRIFFIDIHNDLITKYGCLLDTHNVFASTEKLDNLETYREYERVCVKSIKLNIFVDCTNAIPDFLDDIFVNNDLNHFFIVSNEAQCQELMNKFDKKHVEKLEINYNWNDLTEETQRKFLKTKINFHSSRYMFNHIFGINKQINSGGAINVLPDLSDVFDDQLLNLMIEDIEISVNSGLQTDLNEKHFKLLNMPRFFQKNIKDRNSNQETKDIPKISLEQLILETRKQKFVLISDKAGNGKSWMVKNLMKMISQKNPTRWVTYVDLKHFIMEFKTQLSKKDKPEFSAFMADKILKTTHKFESKIFQSLYKDGKVSIAFDGFDEIAPDCAEFVSSMAQSFQYNGENQLWIVTRDFFEVNLQEKLELNFAYGLKDTNYNDGIDLIAKSWMLMDMGDCSEIKTLEEFNQHIKNSLNFENFVKKAKQIVNKIRMRYDQSIGMPQMFKMIADGFKDEQDIDELKQSKMYEKFLKNLYRRWSREKGSIREDASIESQSNDLNFWRFHQYHAILKLLPKLVFILFPIYDDEAWPIEEIIACGIVSIRDGEIYFLHETFREYFAADALVKALKSRKINEKVLDVLADVLTLKQFNIIRMFLNDTIDPLILAKILPEMKKFITKFNEMENFEELFRENHENLINFVLSILKDGDYDKVKYILYKSSSGIAYGAKIVNTFFKFQEFLCNFLSVSDLKDLISNREIFKGVIGGFLKMDIFVDFVFEIERKTGHEFVQKELKKAIDNEWMQTSNFSFFIYSSDSIGLKFKNFLKTLHKFITPIEMFEFFQKTVDDDSNENILLRCVSNENDELLRIFWTNIEEYFTAQNMSQYFRDLVRQRNTSADENIFHKTTESQNLEVHKTFWELILKTFNDREELKDFILQKNDYGNNYLHQFVMSIMNLEIFDFTFKMLKENFSDIQLHEIIQSRGMFNKSLIHCTVQGVYNIHSLKYVWQMYRSSCKSEQEYCKVLKEVTDDRSNIFNCMRHESPVEILNFIIDEIEMNCTKEEIRKMLSNPGWFDFSILHAAVENKSPEFLKIIWQMLQKYFSSYEILEMVKHVESEQERNFLFFIDSSVVFEFAFGEIEKIATYDEIKNLLGSKGVSGENILQHDKRYGQSPKLHETLIKIFEKYFESSEVLEFTKKVVW